MTEPVIDVVMAAVGHKRHRSKRHERGPQAKGEKVGQRGRCRPVASVAKMATTSRASVHPLAVLRERFGLSQEELAVQLGVATSTVSRWELGEVREVRGRGLRKLADRFGLHVDEARALFDPPDKASDDVVRPVRAALELVIPSGPSASTKLAVATEVPLEIYRDRVFRAAAARTVGQRPCLTLVAGFAGSGKSEMGRFLAGTTGWTLLDKDVLTRPMTEQLLLANGLDPNDRHTEGYRSLVRPLEYRSLMAATWANLDTGVSTVITAPLVAEMADRDWLHRVLARCSARGVDVAVVWVDADDASMHAYIEGRDAARDTWKLTHWDEYLASIDLSLRPAAPHVCIDNSQGIAVSLTKQAMAVVEVLRE